MFEGMFKLTTENLKLHDSSLKEEYSIDKECSSSKSSKKTSSTCSSRSSNTNSTDSDRNEDSEDEDEDESSEELSNSQLSEYSSMNSEEIVNATVYNFSCSSNLFRKIGKLH